MAPLIETIGFSEAKAHLSDLMSSVVHDYEPKAVSRHHGKEAMLLLPEPVIRAMLDNVTFDARVTVHAGEFVIRLPELNLVGGGTSLDGALDDLLEIAADFAEQYLGRLRFYQESENLARLTWVAKIAFTPEDARRALFDARPEPQEPLAAAS